MICCSEQQQNSNDSAAPLVTGCQVAWIMAACHLPEPRTEKRQAPPKMLAWLLLWCSGTGLHHQRMLCGHADITAPMAAARSKALTASFPDENFSDVRTDNYFWLQDVTRYAADQICRV